MDATSLRSRVAAIEAEVAALARALRHDRTPLAAKALIAALLAYLASPLDPIPDVIPLLGHLDELLLLPVGLWAVRRLVPEDVMAECRAEEAAAPSVGRVRWVVAVLIVIAWAVLAAAALRLVVAWP